MSINLNGNNRFKFTLASHKFLNSKFEKLIQSVTLPGFSMGLTTISTPVRDIYLPGNSLDIDDLTIRFMIDENLDSWYMILNWILECRNNSNIKEQNIFSDATLVLLSNTYKPIINFSFNDLFPYTLSQVEYSTDNGIEVQHANVSFKFSDISVSKEEI